MHLATMTEDEIRQLIEEIDPDNKIDPAKIEEFIVAIKEREINDLKDGDRRGDAIFHTLSEQYAKETDWRKRASIAAQIISAGL